MADSLKKPALNREKSNAMQFCNMRVQSHACMSYAEHAAKSTKSIMQFYINLRYLPLSSPLVIFTASPSSTRRFNLLQMLPVFPS